MAVDEPARRALRQALQEVLGEGAATTLMEFLPSEQPATKGDMIEVKRDVADLKVDMAEVKRDVADLKVDMAEVKRDVAGLEERFDLKLEATEHRLMATFRSEFIGQTRTFIIAMLMSLATMGSLAFAAARLT